MSPGRTNAILQATTDRDYPDRKVTYVKNKVTDVHWPQKLRAQARRGESCCLTHPAPDPEQVSAEPVLYWFWERSTCP